MRKGFYLKLAAGNIKKNSRIYIPFLIAAICNVMVISIMYALTQNSGLSKIPGGSDMQIILLVGSNIMVFFSVIFLFYTNSFLMKRRKKEFGVYNILGMEKKHIAKVIGYETFYIALLSIFLGLSAGLALNKVFVLLALRMMHTEVVLGFEISWKAMILTTGIFAAIFFLILLSNLFQVYRTKPVELLKGGNTGEKEPRTKGVMAILGCISMGVGYWIAITTKNPLGAVNLFFVAVLLVIVGTYLLFAAGSIAVLKLLRSRKEFYYQPRHFIAVSGMIYRMKQNAVGLANICILSTGVLLLVSTTVSLYAGTEDAVKQRYPNDLSIESASYTEESAADMEEMIEKKAEEQQLSFARVDIYPMLNFSALSSEGGFEVRQPKDVSDAIQNINNLYFLTLDGFNKITDSQETLKENEILMVDPKEKKYERDQLEILYFCFQIKKTRSAAQVEKLIGPTAAIAYESYFIVVKDLETLEAVQAKEEAVFGTYASFIKMHYDMNFADGTEESEQIAYSIALREAAAKDGLDFTYVEGRAEGRKGVWALYSGFLFLGILLGLLFLLATVLIIYYKQISEGYEDKERYQILQKVGMSRKEIKQTIDTQMLMVFFLPLLTAGIHLMAAFPMVKRGLALLLLTNEKLFMICTVISFLVFIVVYALIYRITARSYYKIISASKV